MYNSPKESPIPALSLPRRSMACNHHQLRLCHSVRSSIASLSSPLLPTRLTLSSRTLASTPIRVSSPSVSATCFTWDDVVRISDSQDSSRHSSDLQGFFEKIRVCNRGLVSLTHSLSVSLCMYATHVWLPRKARKRKLKFELLF